VNATSVTLRERIGTTARGLLGAVSLVGGLTWILLNLGAPRPVTDMIVGVVLAAGGLVLLMPHRVELPGRATAAAVVGAGVGGTLAGILAESTQLAGMYTYLAARGWPSAWLARGAVAADPATARQVAEQASWQVDVVNLVADLYVWGLVGLLLVAGAGLLRRSPQTGSLAPEPALEA
jgi:hypothetical protein